ncbi:MAG: septum site-determining protein MinC [Cyanobacteriota bacterium]
MTTVLAKNIIDLTDNANTAQALSKFEEIIISKVFENASVSIVLGEFVLTQGHMARLKSLAEQNNSKIDKIYSSVVQTQLAALNSGLTVSEKAPKDLIFEDFKNSFNNIELNTQSNMIESIIDPTIGQLLNNNTEQTSTNTNSEEKEKHNTHREEILPDIGSSQSSEFKTINEVIEILNVDKQMVQHKIDLPFEKKDEPTQETDNSTTKKKTTLYINQTLRSGQVVTHDGNIIIAGDTHPGSEVVAGGDIVVWGTLGGIAHAGAGNNYKASIRALKMDPIQLRIADYIARRPDKTTDFNKELSIKPEVARISNGEIRIYSLK